MPHTPVGSPSTIDRRNFLQLLATATATLSVSTSAHAATASAPAAAKTPALKLTVLYGPPTDVKAFEMYYAETHLPLAKKMSGFSRLEISKGLPGPDGDKPAPFHRMAEFWFDSPAAMGACFESPEAKAASDDLKNFATGGVTLLVSEIAG